ncbi:S-layer homology domain-containing protein [Clostridia bacterium]|nr:S-layer homology domain-containing protein [Clostridia bacterium]
MNPTRAWAFSDVNENHWASQSISVLASKGLVSGYADGLFRPEASLTRAEAVVLLVNANGASDGLQELKDTECIFRDVEKGHWASAYINVAWERGLVSGYPDGSFKPEQQVSRLEFTTMLTRALEMDEYGSLGLTFRDEEQIPAWAKSSVNLATSYGLISGYPDGTFRGSLKVRRDEATAMLGAFLKEVGTYYDFYGTLISYDYQKADFIIGKQSVQIPFDSELLGQLEESLETDGLYLGVISQDGKLCYLESTLATDLEPTVPKFLSTEIISESSTAQIQVASTLSAQNFDSGDAMRSSLILRQALGMNDTYQGQGEIIAIIDSGIDPGLSSLTNTPDGDKKLIGFYDVTEEGKITGIGAVAKTDRYVSIEGKQYDLQGTYTLSGRLPYAILDESVLKIDLDVNGRINDQLLVLFADSEEKGVYDTLYIDTDHDFRFSDEKSMTEYTADQEWYNLSKNDAGDFNVIVSEIQADGSEATLGFDANGHGTAMACAASGNGKVMGTAPASKLLVIKAFNRLGQAQWRDLEEAIRLAVEKGATVVNLSMGYQDSITSGNNSLTYLAQIYSERYGVVFVGAAGNLGPGIHTVATPGNGESVLGVSGYLPKQFANEILGLPLTKDVIWSTSSNGPRDDGYVGIDVSAPAIGVLPTPEWDSSSYKLVEGTSVASALASGVVASFLSQDGKVDRNVKESAMIDIVRDSAKIADFEIYQSGNGILDYGSLDKWSQPSADLSITTWNKELGVGLGLYGRDYTPGSLPIYVEQSGDTKKILYWQSDKDWVKPKASLMVMPKEGIRTLPLEFDVPEKPGIYYASLTVSVLPELSEVKKLYVSAIVPYVMQQGKSELMELEIEPRIDPGEIERIFIKVEEGSSNLQATINPHRKDIEYWFFDPAGRVMAQNTLDGSTIGTVHLENPVSGVWEIVVVGGLENSLLSDSTANVNLNFSSLQGDTGSKPATYDVFVGNITKSFTENEKQWVSLCVRDNGFRPQNGITIEIEGRMYEVVDGWVRIKMDQNQLQKIMDGTINIRF